MTLSITFYNNIKYTKDDFMNRDRDFFGNGVVSLTDFPLTLGPTPLTLTIGNGVAWVDGYRIANDTMPVPLMIDKGDAKKRIDIIQIGHDDANACAVLTVKKGVPADTPIEPGADPGCLKLHAIVVEANVTSLTSDKVTDRRQLVPLKVSGAQISFAGALASTQLGAANGVAPLDAAKLLPSQNLPLATAAALGAIKIGTGFQTSGDGTLSVTPTTVGAVATAKLGQASGVATLGSDGKVPTAQLPTYILASEKGSLNGVATLDGSAKLSSAQLPSAIPAANLPLASSTTTGVIKVGSGFTYAGDGTLAATPASVGALASAKLGQPSGAASLDANGFVPKAQLGNVPPSNLLTMPMAWIG